MRKSQSGTGSTNASVNLEESIQQKRGQGQSLSEDIREPMEQAFGADFSGVKVHTDSQSDQLNRSIQARAFTTGQDVFFKQGEYNPGSKDGQELLAHELTHVVQQTGTVQRDDDPAKKDKKKSKSTIEELRDALGGWGADSAQILQLLGKASASEKKQILTDSKLMGQLQSKLSRREMIQALNALEAPLKQKLNAAMKGWGCDAQVIKDLTASAKDTEKKAVLADTALVARLSSELSRADRLAILSSLNAPLKDKLNAAMDGWGTDEQAIRELMVNATGAERNKALSDTVLVSRLASELSLSEMMSILADAGVPFKTRFELALNPWSAGLSQLQPLVENATDAERQTVWSDAALMSQANTALGEQDYLTLVTTLGMFQPGTTAEDGKSHTSAGDADTYIQTHIATYVAEAVKNGRQIAGLVAVVDNADWDRAGIAHYGASTWNGGKKTQINGFVDSQGRVWIHKDRGNAGTMIHEAVHKYSDNGLIGISQPLNEGVTEYFTRKVCAAVTPPITGRLNYQNNYDCVVVLVSLVTESTIASAYFDGKTDELKNTFIKAKSEKDWDDFIGETKQNRWANATRLCTP